MKRCLRHTMYVVFCGALMFLHVSIKNIILYIDLLFYVYFIVPRIRRYIIILLFDGIFIDVRVFHLQ